MAATTTAVSSMAYFLPIFAFLLVFFVVYALLKKYEVLGNNNSVALFIAFILAGFFVIEASLVEFVQFSSAWFAVIIIGIFFIMTTMAFIPGKGFNIIEKGWFGWAILGLMIGMFIIASAYVFNWVINWGLIKSWFDTDWFGMILLLIIAGIASYIITKS